MGNKMVRRRDVWVAVYGKKGRLLDGACTKRDLANRLMGDDADDDGCRAGCGGHGEPRFRHGICRNKDCTFVKNGDPCRRHMAVVHIGACV